MLVLNVVGGIGHGSAIPLPGSRSALEIMFLLVVEQTDSGRRDPLTWVSRARGMRPPGFSVRAHGKRIGLQSDYRKGCTLTREHRSKFAGMPDPRSAI